MNNFLVGAIGWVGVKFHRNFYRNISTLFTNVPLLLNMNAPQIPLIYKTTPENATPNSIPKMPLLSLTTRPFVLTVEVEFEEGKKPTKPFCLLKKTL